MDHGVEKAAAAATAAAAAATFKMVAFAISVTITPHRPDAFTSNSTLLLQHVYMSEALFGADDEDKAWVYLSDLCLFLYNLIECGVWHGTHPLT